MPKTHYLHLHGEIRPQGAVAIDHFKATVRKGPPKPQRWRRAIDAGKDFLVASAVIEKLVEIGRAVFDAIARRERRT